MIVPSEAHAIGYGGQPNPIWDMVGGAVDAQPFYIDDGWTRTR